MVECCIILAVANCILAVVSIKILGKEYKIHAFIGNCLKTLHIEEINHILTMASMYKVNGDEVKAKELLNTADFYRDAYNITDEELRNLEI